MARKMRKSKKEGEEAGENQRGYAMNYLSEALGTRAPTDDHYSSESMTDSSNRGGELGSENEMPEGGDSTRFPVTAEQKKGAA
jgi:hypothetical protein